jgi:hypothetical protein
VPALMIARPCSRGDRDPGARAQLVSRLVVAAGGRQVG